MKTLELIGELFLVDEKRPLARDSSDDRFHIASEIVTIFERQGYLFVRAPREYHVNCLFSSVPFVRFICGATVSGFDLAEAAEIPPSSLSL